MLEYWVADLLDVEMFEVRGHHPSLCCSMEAVVDRLFALTQDIPSTEYIESHLGLLGWPVWAHLVLLGRPFPFVGIHENGVMQNFYGHHTGQRDSAEVLCCTGTQRWLPIAAGEAIPEHAIPAGNTWTDGQTCHR